MNPFLGVALLVVGAGFLSACTTARSGPTSEAIVSPSAEQGQPYSGFDLVDVTPQTVGPFKLVRRGASGRAVVVGDSGRVALASGDVIKIVVSETREGGLFAPLTAGGTTFQNVRVDHAGAIHLPYAGTVFVRGADARDVSERIRSRLAAKGAYEPQVYVELYSDRAGSVLVSGDVKTPGRVSLLDGGVTLLDAIAKAGGGTRAAHQQDVVLRRASKVTRLGMADVVGGRNLPLQRGDQIVVEDNIKTFTTAGALVKPGQVEFNKPQLTLADAISLAGGLKDNAANPTGVFVFRLHPSTQGTPGTIFRFDMAKPETLFVAQAFEVRPNDTVFITNADSYEWEKLVAPIALTLSAVRSGTGLVR